MKKIGLIILCGWVAVQLCTAQAATHLPPPPDTLPPAAAWRWLSPADTFHPGRFWGVAAGGAAVYGATAYGLYQTWYKQYELIGFHTFDDSREWMQLDKLGHVLTTYTEARLVYGGARWTGLSPARSRLTAAIVASILQGTVEVMDGFSAKWGFSWTDMAANTLGAGVFVAQDALWAEQRILFKLSGNMAPYPRTPVVSVSGEAVTDLAARGHELFGTSVAERLLKDYNTMTIWASVNVRSFAPQSRWPGWLNVAVGKGAGNLYGGFENTWEDAQGQRFTLSADAFPRYRQFYLAPDLDLTRLRVRSPWLRTVLSVLNFVKIPAPALEVNTLGGVKWHWLYF